MSVSHIGEASFPSPNALLINNNDASTVNQNLKQEAATAEEAPCPKSPEQDPTSWPELGGITSSPAFSFIKSSPHKEQESPILNQEESSHQLFPVNDVTALISPQVASNPEVLPKSILKPKICQEELLSEHDSKDNELPRAASLPKRSIKYSTDSITTSSQTKNSSESGSGSLSKIPVPVSTMTKSSRKRSRKNSITKVAGANRLSECIYEAMIWGDGEDNSANMSDGYIDEIIQQSSKKSTDRGLDSSGDFLDDSEEVFEEEERRKEARDNMMKFLELTGDKRKTTDLNPPMCAGRLESKGRTPVMNLKSNFQRFEKREFLKKTVDDDSLLNEQEIRSLKNQVCMYETRIESLEDQLMVAKAAVEEKDEKCDQMWRDLKALEVDMPSSNIDEEDLGKIESSKLEMIVKGHENKLYLYESKIEALEDQLKIAKTAAVDKDLECEQLRREVNLLVSMPEKSFDQVDDKDSSQVEHLVKGLENKLALYENKIESLEDQLKIAKTSVEDMDKTCEELTRELKVTESERSTLEVKTKDMDVAVSVKKIKLSDQDEELRTLKSKNSQLELELNEESNKVELLENKRKNLDALINGFEIEVSSLKRKLEMCDDENDKIKDDLKIKSEIIDKKSSEIEESNRRIGVLDSDITKFENTYQDANMRLIKSAQENQEIEAKMRDLQTKVKDLEREIQTFNQQSFKYDEKMKELEKDKFKNKRAMFEKSVEKVDLSCRKCESFEKKLKSMEGKLKKAEEELKAALEKHENLVGINQEIKSEIDESLSKNETLIGEYKAKEVDLIAKETEMFGLKNKIASLENNVEKLEVDLKKSNERLEALSVVGEDSDRNLNVTKATMNKIEEEMESLKDENLKLKEANKVLEQDFIVHSRLVKATDDKLSKCEDALDTTKKDFDANRHEMKVTLDELNSLKASKLEIDLKYDKLVEDHEKIRLKLSEVEMKSEECERTLAKLEKENEILFADWTSEKAKNETVVQGLEDEVSQLMML